MNGNSSQQSSHAYAVLGYSMKMIAIADGVEDTFDYLVVTDAWRAIVAQN